MQPAPDSRPAHPGHRLVFAADPVSVRDGLARLLGAPPASTLSATDRATVEIVLAEVLNNVAEHAYAAHPGMVEVALAAHPAGIACQVVDSGAPMPGGKLPEGRQPTGPGTALADLPEGGFGWHLIRSLTRDLRYVRTDAQNHLAFLIPVTR